MTVATEMPDDPRRELAQRLVLVLADVREERRKRKADARLHADLDAAHARFDYAVGIALDRWLDSRGFW